jgi:serine protease Do
MKMRVGVKAAALALSFVVSASFAALTPVPGAPENVPIKVSADQTPQRIQVKSAYVVPTNERIGAWHEGLWCSETKSLYYSERLGSEVLQDFGRIVRRELEGAGYPKQEESAFQDSMAASAAEYQLAATMTAVAMNLCGTYREAEGGVWIKLRWELFSPRERRVVYSAVTEGAMRSDRKNADTEGLMRGAITAAARNLLAERGFVEQATRPAQSAAANPEQPVLRIVRRVTPGRSLADRLLPMQSAVVTLYSGAGSGSGFYIDPSGYLLTSQHVVGDAKFVKVKLASGKELLGEVVRSARARDVALVKTEPVALAVFELSAGTPAVGVEVLALGSPLGEANSSSVTRGILSAVREVDRVRWIQSDVKILPGSSGGPLVGPSSGVVGIATSGLAAGMAGINYFVPVDEAISELRLGFVGE